MSLTRCAWAVGRFDAYVAYHDKEWGVPVHDDHKMFEFLVLEGAQAGLSWATVLNKRQGYRLAFMDFDPGKVSEMLPEDVRGLQKNPEIIRNPLKIESAINNAKRFLEVQYSKGSFCDYLWAFVDGQPIVNHWRSKEAVPSRTALSDCISKDMKSKGFSFVGSTIIYALLQAVGIVNDHTTDCFRHQEVSKG